jgi:ABC-type Na+ efflux pump permease subunit
MPYHDSGRIRSMTAYKRQGITRTRGEEDTEKKEQKTGEQKTQKKKRTHTKKKKTQEQGKEDHSPEKTITFIFVSAFAFVIAR